MASGVRSLTVWRAASRWVGTPDAWNVNMWMRTDNLALRVLFWALVVLVPGGLLLLAWVGADAVRSRLREEAVSVKDAEAPADDDATAELEASPAPAAVEEAPVSRAA
jgi:hypothetical protein